MPERLAPNPWLTKWTHDEIDAGADIIVMHGAPLLHGVEIYRGRPIFYDLGNFIYNVPPTLTYIDEPMAWESVVASVQFEADPEHRTPAQRSLKSISLRPVVLNNIGDGQPDVHNAYASNQFLHTRGLPAPATGARAGYILERLADASKPFGTTMEIKGETAEIALTSGARHESKQGIVGKRRLHAHRSEHARERRGTHRRTRDHGGTHGSGSWLWRRHHGTAGGTVWSRGSGGRYRPNLVEAGNTRAKLGLTTLRFQEGDASICMDWAISRLTWSSVSLVRCSHRDRSTWPRRWCG